MRVVMSSQMSCKDWLTDLRLDCWSTSHAKLLPRHVLMPSLDDNSQLIMMMVVCWQRSRDINNISTPSNLLLAPSHTWHCTHAHTHKTFTSLVFLNEYCPTIPYPTLPWSDFDTLAQISLDHAIPTPKLLNAKHSSRQNSFIENTTTACEQFTHIHTRATTRAHTHTHIHKHPQTDTTTSCVSALAFNLSRHRRQSSSCRLLIFTAAAAATHYVWSSWWQFSKLLPSTNDFLCDYPHELYAFTGHCHLGTLLPSLLSLFSIFRPFFMFSLENLDRCCLFQPLHPPPRLTYLNGKRV